MNCAYAYAAASHADAWLAEHFQKQNALKAWVSKTARTLRRPNMAGAQGCRIPWHLWGKGSIGQLMHRVILLLCFMLMFVDSSTLMAESSDEPCEKFFSPFMEQDRHKFENIINRCVGGYGDYRSSKVVGHRHSGVDLRGEFGEKVYPIGSGKVNKMLWKFPNQAVVILHTLPDGKTIYSLYAHVEDVKVKIGDVVDENTEIARLFNADEFRRSKFKTAHVHLEIRKSMEDKGRASISSMSMEELNRYCINPKDFMKEQMK